jgi:hypothetical protein
MRVHVEFLALAFSKYLLFSGIESWRQGATKPFDQCLLGKGQRTQAIRYLIEKKILIYDNNRRTRTNDFIENVNLLEKEIKEKKREGELF